MVAAVFEMVIEAEEHFGIVFTILAFLAGAIIFTLADVIAEKKGGGAGILLGIGLDSIPESLAIGASIAAAGPAMALAILIGIQNVPEGIASYREMMTGKTAFKNNPRKALTANRYCIYNSDIPWTSGTIFYARYGQYYCYHPSCVRWRHFLYALF